MNTSATDRHWSQDTPTGEAFAVLVFITVVSIITCPFTTVFNALIIISVKTKSLLRTTSNFALACLATTDTMMGVIGQPLFISWVTACLQGHNSRRKEIPSVLTLRLLTTVLLLQLAMINVERYIAIKHSFQHTTIVTEARLICSCAFLWIIALLLTFPFTLLDLFSDGSSIRKMSIVIILLSVATIAFCQVVLYREARRHENEIAQQQVSEEVKKKKKEKKALKTTTTVLFFLLLNYSPLILVQILVNIHVLVSGNLRYIFQFTAIFSVIANSLVNPIIYCVRVRRFRVAFIELLFRKSHAQAKGIETRVFRVLNRVKPQVEETTE